MSVMLLAILALISMQLRWPDPPAWLIELLGPTGPLTAMVTCLALVWAGGSLYTWFYCRAIRRDPGQARFLLHWFHSRQKIYFLALICAFLGALYFLGWGQFVATRWGDEEQYAFWPGKQLALLAPLLIGLACSWLRFYDVEKAVHQIESLTLMRLFTDGGSSAQQTPFLSRLAYLGLQIRFNLLLIVPPLVLMLVREIFLWAFPALQQSRVFEPAFFMVFLLLALLAMPWMLRVFLGLRPLPAGPLRDRLEGTVHRLQFRFTSILLWNTRHSSANAMVTGILPWPRYIVLTDQLLRDLSPDEVEAVIGHEIGHVKHHHMFFYMVFLFASLLSLGLLWQICEKAWMPALSPWLKDNFQLIAPFPPLLGAAIYLFLVFGYLSRRCETQADIFGSRTISSEVFISALEKVAALNCIPREKPGWLSSWRHPSIASRVNFLRRIGEDPALEPRFQRRVGLFKWSLALVLSVVLVTLWKITPEETAPKSGEVVKSQGELR